MASDPGNTDGKKPAGGKAAPAPGQTGASKPAQPAQSPAAPAQPGAGNAPVRGPFLIVSPSALPQNAQPQKKPPQPDQPQNQPQPNPASPSAAPAPSGATIDDEPTVLADEDPSLEPGEPPERLVDPVPPKAE